MMPVCHVYAAAAMPRSCYAVYTVVQVCTPPFRVWVMDAVHTRFIDKMIALNKLV
jgi:hypothetical protein